MSLKDLILEPLITVQKPDNINIYKIVKSLSNVEQITAILNKYDINTAYNDDIIALFSKIPNGFAGECNELIFSTKTFEPLCIPPRVLGEIPQISNIQTLPYRITKINDGTMITLYYNDGWFLSSTHSYDIGNKYYMGNKNYYEMLYELLPNEFKKKYKCNYDTIFTIDLPITNCYTFIIHHPNTHIVGDHGVWQVQTVDLKTRVINYNYLDYVATQEIVLSTEGNESTYGYIYRNGVYDFIVRTNFLNLLKHALYNMPKNVVIDHTNRYNFIIMRIYLTPNFREFFRKIIPLAETFIKYDEMIKQITNNVISVLKGGNNEGKYKNITEVIIESISDKDMLRQIKSKEIQDIIKDMCRNPCFAYEYSLLIDIH